MKKTIAIFLSLLLLLGLTAFIGPRTANAAAAATRSDESAEEAVINAFSKACEAKSLRYETDITMELVMKISAQGVNMDLPFNLKGIYGMDINTDPYLVREDLSMDLDMGVYGSQSYHALIYARHEGEKLVNYTSEDGGVTWTVQQSDNLHALLPEEAFGMIRDHAQDVRRVGTEAFNGAEVTVYTCQLEGKFLGQIMSSSGLDGVLSEISGEDVAPMDFTEMGDIPLTIYIDGDGYPLYYSMDMTEVMNDLLAEVLQSVMGMAEMEGVEFDVDISLVQGGTALSDFDAIEPIVIPEAALNAPEA